MFVMDAAGEPKLKMCVGLKKYTKDPSSVDSLLFGHSYFYVGDVEEGFGEITRFDWDCLLPTIKVNAYKVKHYRMKLEEDSSIGIFEPPNEDDAQVETIRVKNAVFSPSAQ